MVSPQVISGPGAGTAFVIPARLRPVPTRFLRDVCLVLSPPAMQKSVEGFILSQ